MKRPGNFFTWIVILAAGLMITIAVAQIITQESLTTLRRGNGQATTTFTMNNRLQEMVNLAFELQTKMLSSRSQELASPSRGLKDSLTRLEYNIGVLEKLWADTVKASTLNQLVKYVGREVTLSFDALNAIEKKNVPLQQLKLDSLRSGHWGDSIYSAAISFQKGLEQNLAATLDQNNRAASRLSVLNRLLAGLALLAVLVLATIIIRRQVKQLSLIKDLEDARKVALQSAEAKDQFLANMSHEIRTPLNAIKGFGRILAQTPLNPDQQKYASIISTASENLLNIVNDILDFSKIEAGNLVMKKKVFHLYQVVSEVQMMFTPLSQEKELNLLCSVDPAIPVYLKADSERLRQILVNLLSNAIKFTNAGNVSMVVELKEEKSNSVLIRFSVTDTGVGIPMEKVPLIFERFEQLDYSFTRQQGGTGLGLAITKKLVEAMGGSIQVKSEVNSGSVFTLEIEFEKVSEAAGEKEALLPSQTTAQVSLKQMKLLVAEDNKMNQLLVKSILDKYEIASDMVENGKDAVEAMQHNVYDLILMDVQMPVVDGITATRIYRKNNGATVPVIAMTAHVLPGEREKCIEAGMNDYLTKPLDEEELVAILKRFFTVKRKQDETNQPTAGLPGFNIGYLNSICRNDKQKVRLILEELRKVLPEEIQSLASALEKKDRVAIKRVCHHFKATLSPMLATSVAVQLLEKLYRTAAIEGVEQELADTGNQFIEELQKVQQLLTGYLKSDL